MISLSRHRYLDAFLKLLLLSALLHGVVALPYALIFKDTAVLNYFHIVDLDVWFPQIIETTGGDPGSLAVWAIGYAVVFFLFTK